MLGNMEEELRRRLYLATHMLLQDNTSLEIESVSRIREYNDICVRLTTSTLRIDIWGSNLSISDYNNCGVAIKGLISSIEFERLKKRGDGDAG